MTMLTFDTVSYFYPESKYPAIHNLTLAIKAGERIAVMGTNGSGKTTFAHLVAGILEPSRGILKKHFKNDDLLPVGMIFQNPDNQLIAMTVEKELAFTLENLSWPSEKIHEEITKIAKRFHITHLLKKLTNELSGGEKQKVALASVMISNPELLLLDEPDSFLDHPGQKELLDELTLIKQIRPETTIIHITQYQNIARQYDRLLVFANCELVADNQPETIFEDNSFCLTHGLAFEQISSPDTSFLIEWRTAKIGTTLDKISCYQLTFGYEESNLFENLTLTLSRSEIIGVTGFSGSGKTTFGLIINRLLDPTSGDISFLDHSGNKLLSDQLPGQVSMVFQQPERQWFRPTVVDELKFGQSNFNRQPDKTEFHQLGELIGLPLTSFANRDPISLSGGEQRRLAIGSIIAFLPNFIVFDEPTCGLDIPGYERFVQLVQQLRDFGVGIILISHDQALINRTADRVLTFENQTGTILTRQEFANLINPTEF